MEELHWKETVSWDHPIRRGLGYRYGRLECIKSGETFAYIDRQGYTGKIHDEAAMFLYGVFTLWSVSVSEVETYGIAFEAIPLVHLNDIAVLSLGWTLSDRKETDKGPWLWEF